MEELTQFPAERRPAKRPRFTRGIKRMSKKAKPLPVGKFRVVRWSSLESTNNCHVQIGGNDTVFSGENATVFALSNVNGSAELTNLFDNYRILSVKYRWVCYRNPDTNTNASFKGIYPRVVWTHDFNDAQPIQRALIYQRSNIREWFATPDRSTSQWYTLKPAALIQLYESTTSTAYGPKWKQWMDTADTTAPHYGIKYSYDQLFSGNVLRLEAKIEFEFKGVS